MSSIHAAIGNTFSDFGQLTMNRNSTLLPTTDKCPTSESNRKKSKSERDLVATVGVYNPQHVCRNAGPFFRSVSPDFERLEPCSKDATSNSRLRLENELFNRSTREWELHDCCDPGVPVLMASRWWKSSRNGDAARTLANSALGGLVYTLGNYSPDDPRKRARKTSSPCSRGERHSCRLHSDLLGFRLGMATYRHFTVINECYRVLNT